ncbi:MAG: T9SS type A sorting domain-containing protein [Chitinophagaceae bacterium]|nr:T9SS type A sorting domain-containing protein [Chitinophagaceae bacterium]
MKTKLLLIVSLSFISFSLFAQNAGKAFAITGQDNGNFSWTEIRELDLNTGTVTGNIFESGKTKFSVGSPDNKITSSETSPTESMVAAAAYDKKHEKLFFTPLRIGELRWLDLSAKSADKKFYSYKTMLLNTANLNDEANHITRMTIGSDGNGYAITNDGNHLIRFTTGKKIVITDLGNLVDAESSNGLSVHNKCSSWGGDIVGDVSGNLYLFTASHNVFKINIDTRITSYMGSVKNLSGSFTVNGAAVDNNDNVIISSANTFEGFYKVDLKDLSATKLNTAGKIYNASDLANSNLLFQNQLRNTVGVAELSQKEIIGNDFISIYPNPVIGSEIKILFDKIRPGTYNMQLTDVQGRMITTKQVLINNSKQMEKVQLKTKPASGVYMIKIADADKKVVFADKLIID